jgi:hypothetical protein
MKEVLLTIEFTDPTNKFWWDCDIKNNVFVYNPKKQTIHDLIKEICDDEGMILSYNGKPQGNMRRDTKGGGSKIVGYVYRGKGEIYDRNMPRPKMVLWDIWAEIKGIVVDAEIEELDG